MKSTQFHTFKNIMNFLRNWRKPNEFFKRMKKQYLLALIAAPFFCAASVNAQSIQPKLEGVSTSNVFQAPTLQTRAETQTAQPDSIVVEEYGEVVSKEVFKYDDAGRMVERIGWKNLVPSYKYVMKYSGEGKDYVSSNYSWTGKDWIQTSTSIFKYDKEGREILVEFITEKGATPEQHQVISTKYDGNKAITVQEDTTWYHEPNDYYVAGKNTLTKILDDKGNIISEEQFNDVYGYVFYKKETEYDENNRLIKQLSVYYNADGSEMMKYRDTRSYDGEYAEYQMMEICEGGKDDWRLDFETGSKIIEGNPKIIVCYDRANGEDEPMSEWKRTLYYYPNSSTANESIESEAAVRIYTQEGSIVVNTENAEPVAVYSITGKCYYNATATGMTTINNLQAGIYIVRVGDKTLKVRVR